MAATGRAALSLDIEVQGVREVERALDALPADALVTLKARTKEIAKELASRIKAAGRRDSKQSARAAATVRVKANRSGATIVAGPHDLLFGSEFGAYRHFGWYADARFDRAAAPVPPVGAALLLVHAHRRGGAAVGGRAVQVDGGRHRARVSGELGATSRTVNVR
jgi:hypothetical protein